MIVVFVLIVLGIAMMWALAVYGYYLVLVNSCVLRFDCCLLFVGFGDYLLAALLV